MSRIRLVGFTTLNTSCVPRLTLRWFGASAAPAKPLAHARRALANKLQQHEFVLDAGPSDGRASAANVHPGIAPSSPSGSPPRGADGAPCIPLDALISDVLVKKRTLRILTAKLGGFSAAKMSIVDAEHSFGPWLVERAPAGLVEAGSAYFWDATDQAREALLEHLCAFASEQSGERDELRKRLTDMTDPHEAYPEARAMRRRVVLHVGPTNSGKTHSAMQALKAARSGVYCGPLRLLAWEVHDRLNGEGVPCSLMTGQERVECAGARHTAVTIEMASMQGRYELAVVDEIQMLAHEQRGWAWTRALLGLQAEEVHACGDDSAVDLVRRLCELTGDELQVRRYSRLSPLEVSARPVRGVGEVEPGDAVIAFSRREIYRLKALIERTHGTRCCVVYGSLPPETRKEQAGLFNSSVHAAEVSSALAPAQPDAAGRAEEAGDGEAAKGGAGMVLVASDAIGMGLNLNIKRVIFATLQKFDGSLTRPLLPTEVKQIGGRAGRFLSKFPQGTVTCFGNKSDLRFVQSALAAQLEPLQACGLLPTAGQLEAYAQSVGPKPFSKLLRGFFESIRTDSGLFFVCSVDEMYRTASLLDPLSLTIAERLDFCIAPVDTSDGKLADYFFAYASAYADAMENLGSVVELGVLEPVRVPCNDRQISALETTHAVLDAYLWLALKFGDVFVDRERAAELRNSVGALISKGLAGGLVSGIQADTSRDRAPGREVAKWEEPVARHEQQPSRHTAQMQRPKSSPRRRKLHGGRSATAGGRRPAA